jgi:plastocyanin
MNPLILRGLLFVAMIAGCARPPLPESSLTGTITDVKIDQVLTPEVIKVKTGDEVRWVNMTQSPVHISVEKSTTAALSCRRGFVFEEGYPVGPPAEAVVHESVFGATVNSHQSASLCFGTTGVYRYIVRAGGTELSGGVMVK